MRTHPASGTAHAKRDFGVCLTPTTLYVAYIDSLNKRLFHIDVSRPALISPRGPVKTELSVRIRDLAQDVLDLWDAFVTALSQFATELSRARADAIEDAVGAALSMGGALVFA